MASLSERLKAERMARGMEKGIAEGKAEGIVEGLAKGVQTGERAVLIRLLSRRFGPLNAETLTRLNDANQQQLEIWADRFLDARTLDEVFQDH